MGLAPKFKEWVDSLTKIEGIINYSTRYDIQIDSNKTAEVDIDTTRRPNLDYDFIKKVTIYSNLKINIGSTIKSLSLDEEHLEYLNNKLSMLMQQKDLQTWVRLYKDKRRSDYLKKIDSYF